MLQLCLVFQTDEKRKSSSVVSVIYLTIDCCTYFSHPLITHHHQHDGYTITSGSMAWNYDGEAKTAGEGRPPGNALPVEPDYASDVSRIFISLNNSSAEGRPDGGKSRMGPGGSGRLGRDAGAREQAGDGQSPQSPGALAEYFSSLFDESFCPHNFKLVG